MKKLFFLLSMLILVQRLSAQSTEAANCISWPGDREYSLPSQTLTNGNGYVFEIRERPRHDQQDKVTVVAIPACGYVFSSWQPVDAFTISQVTIGAGGQVNPPTVSTVLSPVPQYSYDPVLRFVPQPELVLFDNPGVQEITQQEYWQANFVPCEPQKPSDRR
jgi:hypothetical protein